MTVTSAPVSVCPLGAVLGEGPVWDARDEALWSVDIKACVIHRFVPATGKAMRWRAPAEIGWILPAAAGGFVVGLQDGLYRFDPATGGFDRIVEIEPGHPGNRLNDACTDEAGRIWFGTMDNDEEADSGRFYCCERGVVRRLDLPACCITNGPALSPDGRRLYHTDTLGRAILVADIGDDGTVGAPAVFARIEDGAGYPDGPVIDAEGCLWTGLFGGWAVRRYAPDGTMVGEVRFPVANVTKIAFGGPGLDTIYATTARKGLSAGDLVEQPLAGNLFAFAAGVTGLAVTPARL